MTREAWLTQMVGELAGLLPEDYSLPPALRVSVGFPSGASRKDGKIGQCWSPYSSVDGSVEMFISPVLDDPIQVAATLLHEMVHAAVGVERGHKRPFKQVMLAVGLRGKPTATYPGSELADTLQEAIARIGPYPHAALLPETRKKQTTRMHKLACAEGHEPYVLRGSRKVIALGVPLCPLCGKEMDVERPDEEEESGGDVSEGVLSAARRAAPEVEEGRTMARGTL